ncbi:uncharacterized protein N7459_008052 [Penicillium hispanicum]|uniref:uncharacterized protein n=1 Tax=Penicillium hispanicum TaxID=1080232 RepID=UPI0025424CD7|nr:uncharacterized protein N7459_008052 [Penicillium hispanicum]KAJ5573625.1 hypothetical protein N7459_008052 [Penicillium hispanicum]
MSDSRPRKRSRVACISCQLRKRKCSGEQPCSTCAQIGAECLYNPVPRKRRATSSSGYHANLSTLDERQRRFDGRSNTVPQPVSAASSATSPASRQRLSSSRPVNQSLQANSGAAFVRKLGLRIDPAHAPRLQLFAWNVGERRSPPALSSALESQRSAPITKIISQEEMRRLTAIYFEKVDPCYAFLDRRYVLDCIVQRWPSSPESPAEPSEQPYDAVLCGVAAFGYLFSRREMTDTELRAVETARLLLEKSILGAETPSIDTIAGWVLRAAYLRTTASPHAAWMASCTLMHMIEAAGLHLESPDAESTGLSSSTSQRQQPQSGDSGLGETTNDPDIRRRLFGMARHLNTWISFDLGRSRVVLHGATTNAPLIRDHSPPPSISPSSRSDLFRLLPLSESLDPTGPSPQDLAELESALDSVLDLVYTEPPSILLQCNLMLCIYRRIRALNAHAPLSGRLDQVLALASRALRAARTMVTSTCPWHQVANVPFQVVCTLLAIDNRAALSVLPDAMHTLREVLAVYDTSVMREAYSTAYLLVALHQRRKEDDTRALADVLRENAAAVVVEQNMPRDADVNLEPEQQLPESTALASDAEFSWLGDLMIDMPSLQNFDLDQFLMTDVPWPLPEMGI